MSIDVEGRRRGVIMSGAANAFAQMPNPYGVSITGENAKRAAAASLAEARKNSWAMAVAIVDTAGDLVYFEMRSENFEGPGLNLGLLTSHFSVLTSY